MSNTINGDTSIREISNSLDLGPTGSLQFQFAKLQLSMAELSKKGALDYMDQIQNSQNEQKKVADMLQTVRQAQADAKDTKSGKDVTLSAEILKYAKDNGLAMPDSVAGLPTIDKAREVMARSDAQTKAAMEGQGDSPTSKNRFIMSAEDQKFFADNGIVCMAGKNGECPFISGVNNGHRLKNFIDKNKPTADDFGVLVQSLQSHQDRIGSNTQQLMVFVQDYMGQYNSYLQGSNSAIQQANQTLTELVKVR